MTEKPSSMPRNVMVVDDDDTVRGLLCSYVENMGMNVIASLGDGSEAVDFIGNGNQPVDLVLLDLVMRKLHGNVALPIIKSKRPDLKVIVISAFFMEYNSHFLANLGADGFIEKPVTLAQLEAEIEKVFDVSP